MNVELKIWQAFFLDLFIFCTIPFSFVIQEKGKWSFPLLSKCDCWQFFPIMHIHFLEHAADGD